MKKKCVLIFLVFMILGLGACGGEKGDVSETRKGICLDVITTFAGSDSNVLNFTRQIKEWEEETGNQVNDLSGVSDDSFKIKIEKDFETSSEPDVLFFFSGADANSFIEAGRVVPLEEIRESYPNYAGNMDDSRIPVSLVDQKVYAVPVNGFWEALFVNTEILEAAGVEMPGADYTWEQFLADCEKIKEAGFIPIAAALGHIPHYWWEYTVFNHTSPDTHLMIPSDVKDEQGIAWLKGMRDLKRMYAAGYFPKNTLMSTDDETFALFTGGQAAFLLDGTWKVGSIIDACQTDPDDPSTLVEEKLEQFDVTFVPTQGNRKASDLIGGLSMGYYITRKAWENPEKREAAVRFVEYMTRDEVVDLFAQHTTTALKSGLDGEEEAEYSSLQKKVMVMLRETTSFTRAVQDVFRGECRIIIFDGLPRIVAGESTAAEVVQKALDIYAAGDH